MSLVDTTYDVCSFRADLPRSPILKRRNSARVSLHADVESSPPDQAEVLATNLTNGVIEGIAGEDVDFCGSNQNAGLLSMQNLNFRYAFFAGGKLELGV